MARRGINIKAKAKEIQDSLNQVDSSVSKLGKDANSAVSPVNNAASSIDKLSEAVSKFPKNKLSLNVDIKTSKETLGDSLQPLQELNTEIKSAEKVVNESSDSSNRLKNRVEKFKKTIDQNLDVKVNMSDSIKAAIKKQIPDTSAFETIDNFRVQIEGVANKITGLSDTWQRFSNASENIKTFASDLSASVNSIFPKVKSGEPVPAFKGTVFSAFGDLIENINASINSEQLARFESTADSLRTFTTSLKEMISINKTFGEVTDFIKNINKPATEGGTDTPLNSIIDTITTYVNSLGGLGERLTDNGEDGTQKIKTIINPCIQGITDIIGTIKNLTVTFNTFNDTDSETALASLIKAKEGLEDFITQLGSLGEREARRVSDSNGEYKVIEVLDSRVQGTRDVLKTIELLSTNLKAMSDADGTVTKGITNINTAETNLEKFITTLGQFSRREKIVKDENSESGHKTVELLNTQVQGTRDVLKTIDILSSDLVRMANTSIPTGLENVKKASDSLRDFINKLNEVGARDTHTNGLFGNIKSFFVGSDNVETFLSAKVQSVRDILSTVRTLSTNLTSLATDDVKKGTDAIDKANTSLYNFIDQLGSLGERSQGKLVPKPTANGGFTLEFEREINSKVEGIQDILRVVGNLSSKLEQMGGNTIPDGIKNIDDASTNLQSFMVRLGGFGRIKEEKAPETADGTHEIVEHLNSQVQSVRDVLKSVDILSSDLKNMADDKIKKGLEYVDKSGKVLNELINKLGGFIRSELDKTDSEGNPRKVEVLDEQVQSVRDVLKSIDILSSNLADMSEDKIKKGIENVENARKGLNTFIDKLGGFTRDSKKVKDSEGNTRKVELLDAHIQSVRDIIKSVDLLSNALSNLNDEKIGKAFENLDTAKEKLYDFINRLGSFGISSKEYLNSDVKEELNNKIVVVREILKVINTLSNTLSRLSVLDTNGVISFSVNIERVMPSITDFIEKMSSLAKLPSFDDFERVANAISKVGGALKDNIRTLEHSTRAWIRLKSIMRQIYTAFVGGAVIYSIVRTIKNAVKEMFNLEYAMARVNTIARVSSSELKNMTHYVQEMSATYGIASSKVTKALYDINSATIKGSASLKILEQSAKLAVAGFTDIEKVTDLIAKAVNAYEYSASEAAKISDILFVTVERGINPMEELSEYMGRLFTVAANAGVSLEEVGAGLATLTARGYQTNVASTALNSAILKLSTGTKELNKLFNQYGYASSASALRTLGLSGALEILYKATNGATEKLHDLGFNYRDIRAATTLASGAISEYNKTLALMNDETYKNGLTNESLAKVQDTVIFKFNQLKETYTVFIQSISEYLNQNKNIKDFLNALTDAISTLTKSMQGFNLSAKEQAQAGLVTLIPKLLLAYAVFKPMGKVFSALLAGVSGLTTGFKATGASLISVASSLKAAESPLTSMESEVVAVSKVTDSAKMSVDGMTQGVYSFKNSIDGTSKSIGVFLSKLTQMNQVGSSVSTTGKSTYAGIQSISVGKDNFRYTLPKDIVGKQTVIRGVPNILPQLDTTSFKNLGSTALAGYDAKNFSSKFIKDSYGDFINPNKIIRGYFGGKGDISGWKDLQIQDLYARTNGSTIGFNYEKLRPSFRSFGLPANISAGYNNLGKLNYNVNPSTENIGLNLGQAFRPIIGKTDTSALSVNSLGNVVNTDVGKVAGQYDFKKPLVDLKNLAEETKKTIKTAENATLTVNNLATGYNVAEKAAENLEKTTKAVSARFEAFNAKMKTFGATVGSALSQFGQFALQMAAVNGAMNYFVGAIAELNSQDFGFKDTFSILGDNLKASLTGAAGRFIDILTFGLTNLGEKWSLHYMNTDYVDQKAVRESRLYVGDENKSGFGTVVASEISVLKKLNVIAEGLNEDKIIKVYNNAIDKIQQEARLRKVSKDQLETAIKVASDQRDLLLSYNDTLKKLLPNTQALNDVFNQASKNIEESVEKFASPMEKQLREMMEAQNAVSKLAKMTGLSEEQIKAGGVSVSGSNQLREILEQQQEQQQTELASLINTPLDKFLKKPEYLEKVKGATDELYASFVDVQHALGNWDSFSIKETFDSMIDDASVFAEEWEKIHNAVLKQGDNKELFGLYSHFKQSFADLEKVVKMPEYEQFKLGIDSFIKDISNAFTPEQIALISKQSDDFIKALLDMSELDRSDPKAVSKKLMDMLADPELAKQLDVLGKTYLSSIHSAEQFRKSISKLGIDLSKLGTELSPEGIIGNKFNLQSVREIKERLGGTVYGPKAIEGADFGVIDQYANIAMKGILEHNPVNVIVDSLVTEFKKNDALKDLDTNELQNRAISFIGAIQQIGSYTKDFVKQLSEMDYTKAMNRMRFGSELSTFKQYKMFGKDMISRLLGMDVTGSGGVDFGELLREFEADTKASGFDTARDNMIKRFGDAGETVWSAFADLFKDLINYEKEYISPLNTEFRNLKKRGLNFIKNYKDSMLSPIEQFNKTQALLNRQLSRISRQAKSGELKPESIKNAMDTIDKLYKLNEETMNIKVPAAITASEAVRTGSKEAFDLVARNVFKDTYKVNVRQEKLQQKLVNYSEKLWRLAEQGSKNVSESITLP